MASVEISRDWSKMAMLAFLTSFVSAKPYRMICTIGIQMRMNRVRLSRQMWSHSFLTKIKNCLIPILYLIRRAYGFSRQLQKHLIHCFGREILHQLCRRAKRVNTAVDHD